MARNYGGASGPPAPRNAAPDGFDADDPIADVADDF
jgi:hypothetical protein